MTCLFHRHRLTVLLAGFISLSPGYAQITPLQKAQTQSLIETALGSGRAYQRLAELCDTFNGRLSGSQSLEDAIDWTLAKMKEDGLQNVHGEEALVPRWVRGKESVELIEPYNQSLPMLGLGGSISTPPEGIEAQVLVVDDFEELRKRSVEAKGKIVVFNTPFTEYRETVMIRARGAIEAAKAGGVASLIRSVGPVSLQTPHTGGMAYENGTPKIPHAAITVEDAQRLHRLQKRGVPIRLKLMMEAQSKEDSISRNVIAEVTGSEFPDEVIIVSGHIDSWDVGQGAQDDGGGCIAAWETARLIKSLNLRPKRTIRVVLWTNEENGTRGAKAYVKRHLDAMDKHVLAIESDTGIGQPYGFAFTGSSAANTIVGNIAKLLAPIKSDKITLGAGGADVRHLLPHGVPIMDLNVDRSKYFWYHHTPADTVDKVDETELRKCVATMATMAFLVADSDQGLPR